MTQPAVPDSAGWKHRWTIDAGAVALQPVTRRIARAVLDGGPIRHAFEEGALHDRLPQAMGFAIRDIDSGAAAVLPTVWLVVRRADGGSSAIWGRMARPTVRDVSRSATASPQSRAARASAPPPWPPWSGG